MFIAVLFIIAKSESSPNVPQRKKGYINGCIFQWLYERYGSNSSDQTTPDPYMPISFTGCPHANVAKPYNSLLPGCTYIAYPKTALEQNVHMSEIRCGYMPAVDEAHKTLEAVWTVCGQRKGSLVCSALVMVGGLT